MKNIHGLPSHYRHVNVYFQFSLVVHPYQESIPSRRMILSDVPHCCSGRMARMVGVVIALCLPISRAFHRPSFIGSHAGLLSGKTRRKLTVAAAAAAATLGTAADSGSSSIAIVSTTPISGMKPGTSGLRKKVEVWQSQHYLENFIQSLLNVAKQKNGDRMLHTIIVAGDGRYYNTEAMQIIFRVAAGNGVTHIWVPQRGIMSTPAVSAAIRNLNVGDNKAQGAIVLTASHNPGGPGYDFGIKYNEGLGQPAGEGFTDAVFEETLTIQSYLTVHSLSDVDLNAPIGTEFSVGSTTTKVTIIDPFECYVENLKTCFDFDKLRSFCQLKGASTLLFDGMHGAGGPFARKIFVDELGLPESCLMRCDPRTDFGGCHPDPNLTYASELVKKMGLDPDGGASDDVNVSTHNLPVLGAANDGDGDRNLIAGAQCFVTPSDSLAIICDQWEAIPQFARAGGLKGVARSMPSSAALDVVAQSKGIPCFCTPTGWKFFGNLMSSKEMFGQRDYTPFLCGEESFGTGSDHVREKDGVWAVLAWMSILAKANEGTSEKQQDFVGVRDIVKNHWAKYGRHFYCRYDYEEVDSDAANKVMDLIRDQYVSVDEVVVKPDASGIDFVDGVEFSYTDPVDGTTTDNQGLILNFKYPSGNPARVVFRLSGTGSAGATVRMYIERYEKDTSLHDESAPVALRELAERALGLVQMKDITGRDAPTVIT